MLDAQKVTKIYLPEQCNEVSGFVCLCQQTPIHL
jgi:hypothetical protein